MSTFLDYLSSNVVTLFVVLSPRGVIPFFHGLTANATERRKRIISNRAIVGFLTLT